ncbi:rhoptry 2 [Cryptosporidium sp. chipmunk genotype I]|uniref:rhoptry 2 n=1 Tax=Cryptosporidium sp. chipmunk genotype I TaxID=1280935 RepID=UPI00351A34C3|nr:rhoptry 2 [Cryptosporidium sp. chipmunk genotype I]
MNLLNFIKSYFIISLFQIFNNAKCEPISLMYQELKSKFDEYFRSGTNKEPQIDDYKINNVCDDPSNKLEFQIQHVPLVSEGYINLICKCMMVESEGVPDLNGSQLRGLNCTSDNSLLGSNFDFEYDNDFKRLKIDPKLVKSFKKDYIGRSLKLQIISSINTSNQEEFCRVSMIGFKDDLVFFPKLDTEHYSLIELGTSFCHYLGKRENIFFQHPSPVTEILEGDIFQNEFYFYPGYNQFEEFDKASKYFNEKDLFDWDSQEEYSELDKENMDQLVKFDKNDDDDKYYENKYHYMFEPFLRFSYIANKPYPRVFIKSNVPYTKSITALDRSIKNNYYSVAGKWQVSITPGYSRVNQENSILSILGSKFNSVKKEKYVYDRLKDIAHRWRKLTFSNFHNEFKGCSLGRKSSIPRFKESFKVFDSTNTSFKRYPSNLQAETVFEVMNSASILSDKFKSDKSHCSFYGNIRECLRLIRSRIRDKSLNYVLGHLFINIIYETWITWGNEIWHIASLFNIEKLFLDYKNRDHGLYDKLDPLNSLLTRLFNVQPLVDDQNLDIISVLKKNLINDDLDTCSLEMDIFQFGVLSINPILIDKFWNLFSTNYCMISSDSAFITWITNKFSLKLYNKEESNNHKLKEFRDQLTNEGDSGQLKSWLSTPLPTYFDQIDPEIEVEIDNEVNEEISLPEVYEYNELLEIYNKNDPGNERENSINRRRFFNSNYFSKRNQSKWISFIVRNVPFRDSSKKSLEFKCSIGSWPYKGGEYSWMGNYLCEVIFLSSNFYSKDFDFSTFDSYYIKKGDYKETNTSIYGKASKDDVNESYIRKLSRNRMIGIEFETSYPHRCGIGYLGNESMKTLTPVKGNHLLKISLGFCILNGFKLQWLSDDSFNIYTEMLYKYTQTLEKGLTYYERNGFELSGSVQQRVFSNNTCSGIILEEKVNTELSDYSFKSQTMECQISYDPIIVTDGIRKHELLYMREKYFNLLYNLRFGCENMESKNNDYSGIENHCLNFYPLLEKVKLDSKIPKCKFELTKEWEYLNNKFPNECSIGSRVGDCHSKLRNEMKCDGNRAIGCRLDLFIANNFIKPINIDKISIHFNQISLLLMHGINKYTNDWDKKSTESIRDIISNLVSSKDLSFYLENGVNGILKDRLSLFMDEYSKYTNDDVLDQAKELFSYSGIWLDTHSIPLLWRLVMFRIEDIPLFISKPDLFSRIFKNNMSKSKSNRSFRINSNNNDIPLEDHSLKNKYDISTSIPLYCPLAIGYFWIDKFMWQMYRYPGSDLQNISPIKE